MFIAFFQDRKATFTSLEAAMEWVDRQSARIGMRGHEAEHKGWAQIFNA